jgi:hypothetical protein
MENIKFRRKTADVYRRTEQTNTKVERELLNNKCPNGNQEIVIRKLITRNKVIELRVFCTVAYKIKCNWENKAEKTQLSLEGEKKLVNFIRKENLIFLG